MNHAHSQISVRSPVPHCPTLVRELFGTERPHGKLLNSLGKWWGAKPFVLTRAVILGSLFEASDDPARWPEDLEIFFKLMCLDNAGMWKRIMIEYRILPASASAFPLFSARARDEKNLFEDGKAWAAHERRATCAREALEKRVFYTLGLTTQRLYCCRVEEIDGPPEESWAEINAYCRTKATISSDG